MEGLRLWIITDAAASLSYLKRAQPSTRCSKAAAREASLQHKQKGLPMAVWHDGKVAWIQPDEIDFGAEFPSRVSGG